MSASKSVNATSLYTQSKTPDFPKWEQEIQALWQSEGTFAQSVDRREGQPTFTFYEGPPSANGAPGIHHVMARAIKDIFCRYKTLKGFQVHRKAGWDTHGLPIELSVEKTLGITKKDIGTKITVEEYNAACRREVMKYKEQWDQLTQQMGYWVDLENPYVTFENEYIESVWHLLKRLYDKDLLYKGYTIQPYSPAAGTGLSSHELNQPGCYKSVKDTSCVAMFEIQEETDTFFLAWTTTPWTLPANAALAVGAKIDYVLVETFNAYTHKPMRVWLAKDRLNAYFAPEAEVPETPTEPEAWPKNINHIPWRVEATQKGNALVGMKYVRLMPYVVTELVDGKPEKAFTVIDADFVTTEDGTGIVHIAPTFGADDMRVAKQVGVPAVMATLISESDTRGDHAVSPLVDREGKYNHVYETPYWELTPNGLESITFQSPTPNTSPPIGEGDSPLLRRGAGGEQQENAFQSPTPNPSPIGEGNSPLSSGEGQGERPKSSWQTANPEKWSFLKEKAREMRKEPTDAEDSIWELVRDKRLKGYKFRRQHAVGDFIVDFVCLEKRLILEIDGEYHDNPDAEYIDNYRASELIKLGYQVIRIPNKLATNVDLIANNLARHLERPVQSSLNLNGRYVKNYTDDPNYQSLDIDICIHLKEQNRAFRVEKYEHNYPHCWRTDKPVLYYPLDSWFVATSKVKDKLVAKNKEINWKPESTGTGRFGHWLENLVDWNLSRSRFWGIPLPIWVNEARDEMRCIGSMEELKTALEEAIAKGVAVENNQQFLNKLNQKNQVDLHRPYIDGVMLADSKGQAMYREPDLIDVWFDSGAMPFAQWHYPFENADKFKQNYPADFIAEGVDQTRGWFFTLHAISVLLEDSVAYKNVIANGLVLDKEGNKMSKRLGNAVDPFSMLNTYGADSVRWYMVENNPPWENLRFNEEHLKETQRKFFGTLLNTYNFFAMYANIDAWQAPKGDTPALQQEQLSELDRWVLSELHTLIQEVDKQLADYDPTRAARAIQDFVTERLSNWYVRLSRRRFWKGELNPDKEAAYATLHHCLVVTAQLMSPIAPFFSDWLYRALCPNQESVHLSTWPHAETAYVDEELMQRMRWARQISSLGHAIRKKAKIKARQPLAKAIVPIMNSKEAEQVAAVTELIQAEINIKALETIDAASGRITRRVKPNFKALGPRLGAQMKLLAPVVAALSQSDIAQLEEAGSIALQLGGAAFELRLDEVEIVSEDIPGWSVASEGGVTVALDITLTDDLKREGIARDLVNRIQNLRKSCGLEVTDRIAVQVSPQSDWLAAIQAFENFIRQETLADSIAYEPDMTIAETIEIDGVEGQLSLITSTVSTS